MARKRRTMSARRAPRGDWTYRGILFDGAGAIVEAFGAYNPALAPVVAGTAGANIAILYDSYNYTQHAIIGPVVYPRHARAEGRNPLVKRVRGSLIVTPSTWALGSTFALGIRFGVFEQLPDTGGIFLDTEYNMWSFASNVADAPANWANRRDWVKEVRFRQDFLENKTSWTLHFNFPVNRRLLPHQCFAAYFETSGSQPASVTINIQRWLSALVVDEG